MRSMVEGAGGMTQGSERKPAPVAWGGGCRKVFVTWLIAIRVEAIKAT